VIGSTDDDVVTWDDDEDDWAEPHPDDRFDYRVLPAIFGAYHSARHRLDAAAREHGLDGTEAIVLDTIRREGGCPPWQVRRRLGLHRSTLGSVLDRLERDGRLTRGASAFAIQRFELGLTPSGRTAADLAGHVLGMLEEEISVYTSKRERRGAVAVFEACVALDRSDRPRQ
jgi:DNA-binding MarR family transcriptional regulator